jgi:hypothetical protein
MDDMSGTGSREKLASYWLPGRDDPGNVEYFRLS